MLTGKEKATAADGKTLFSSSVMGQNGKTCSTCHACVKGALGPSLKEDSLETKSLALYLDRYRAEQAAPAPAVPAAAADDEDEDQFGC